MSSYVFKPKGICASQIKFDINNDVVYNVAFSGGCSGNASGLARLVEGMRASDVIKTLAGIKCGARTTSCPDQLGKAIQDAMDK